MIPRVTPLRIALAALGALQLFACNKPDDNGPMGTEVENEIVGQIFAQDGTPVPGAKVRVFPVSYSPQTGLPKRGGSADSSFLSTITDSKGRYFIDSLSRGEYNILAEKGGLLSYQDSVGLSASPRVLLPDTLKPASSLRGIVALQPNHDPSTVTVEVLGTNAFANVDHNGRFDLPALGEGRYTLKVSTTLDGYTSLFTGFSIGAGETANLPDTLKVRFTGIPLVSGLRLVSYDTLASVATFSWSASDYPNLLGYSIFRDTAKAAVLSQNPLNTFRVEDTVYSDTLLFDPESDAIAKSFEYRVRIQDRETDLGPGYFFLRVNAPHPSLARTFLRLESLGAHGNTAGIGDTLRIVADYSNPTRGLVRLSWRLLGQENPLRRITLAGKNGRDTLALAFMDPGSRTLEVTVEDDAGTSWPESIRLEVAQDPPFAFAGPDSAVQFGDTLLLSGTSRDAFGTVVKWEWDIGGTGDYTAHPVGNPIQVVFPDSADPDFAVTLRVTDDDGLVTSHTRHFQILPARSIPPVPMLMTAPQAVSLGGKAYLLDAATKSMFAYDPLTGEWSRKASRLATRHSFGAVAHKGKIYLIGGSTNYYNTGASDNVVEAYDPVSDSWSIKANLNSPRYAYFVLTTGEKLMIIAGSNENEITQATTSAEVYDDSLDRWDLVPYPVGSISGNLFWIGDRFYNIYMGSEIQVSEISFTLEKLDGPAQVRDEGPMDFVFRCNKDVYGTVETGGIIYALSDDGCGNREPYTNMFAINPRTRKASKLPSSLNRHFGGAACIIGKRLYLFGGERFGARTMDSEEYKLP